MAFPQTIWQPKQRSTLYCCGLALASDLFRMSCLVLSCLVLSCLVLSCPSGLSRAFLSRSASNHPSQLCGAAVGVAAIGVAVGEATHGAAAHGVAAIGVALLGVALKRRSIPAAVAAGRPWSTGTSCSLSAGFARSLCIYVQMYIRTGVYTYMRVYDYV